MMIMTYPDGSQSWHDGGLVVRVHEGQLQSATLQVAAHQAPLILDIEVGDKKSFGYWARCQTREKWEAQLSGAALVPPERHTPRMAMGGLARRARKRSA
ncbi:hypothetical protein [Sulfobacillus thermosulfidooxidans]|uniref:hypothetical protein n=1 Tax=Sulfobacillus thermosulfidooxidans TaxID=28034 RepID=UPI0002EEE4FA|nr:hypothetical protein [Sulfobacillus thermosulfidooxidans]